MRTCSLLLVALAASIPAAELTLEDLGRQSRVGDITVNYNDEPFRLRAGMQNFAMGTKAKTDDQVFELGDQSAVRSHMEGLLLIWPLQNRPGLILGAGASRTVVNLSSDLRETATCFDGLAGLTFALSGDKHWRIDLLGYAGYGWGKLGDSLTGKAHEYGVEAALNGPLLRRWNLEWSASVGWGSFSLDPGPFDVMHAGNAYPANLDLTSTGPSVGLALLWRP